MNFALIFLAAISTVKADRPEGDLSMMELTHHFGDIPNCAELGEGRKICTWNGPNNEYYTCLVRSDSVGMDCIYETLKDRESGYFYVRDRGNRGALRRWQKSHELASKNVNIGNVLEVSKTVGHGPVACLIADRLACKWETGNKSPGHDDSLRYLAAPDMYDKYNSHIRLICEFDLETLERTEIPCSAVYLNF